MRPNWKSSFNPRLDTIIKVEESKRPRMWGELEEQVSIHAPVWGATRRSSLTPTPLSNGFNPRPRMGGDLPSKVK